MEKLVRMQAQPIPTGMPFGHTSYFRKSRMVAITFTPKANSLDKLLPHAERRRCPAKSNIINAGDRSESLFLILKGSVTVLIEDDERREMIVAYLNSGDFFGELGLFEQPGRESVRSAWVRAKTECEVAEISYGAFRELTRQEPEILYALGSQMAERLRNTTRKVGDLAFLDVTGRVARTLLELCKQPDAMTHPDGMQIKITRQEIGRIVGCSREMVGRVLKALEEQSLVNVKGKTMVVYGTR
ncbi:hypothetical protein ALP83_04657 [Pseudomonas syringae pv. actinidiae]|nr:DNA-binding transcriptional dual regulator Crp [Pseudomonas syringae pv. persicae]RMP80633.1 Cyclic nucleotide-binding transcriptional regulator Vfr [Pseudomonas syringae pv. actinidiae]RMR59849.1 hypothetical protein ALP83_04657 [Pseudomonas syringae pv. actinidiae]